MVPVHCLRHPYYGEALPTIADMTAIAAQDVSHQRPGLECQDVRVCKRQPHDDVDSGILRRLRRRRNKFASSAVRIGTTLPFASR